MTPAVPPLGGTPPTSTDPDTAPRNTVAGVADEHHELVGLLMALEDHRGGARLGSSDVTGRARQAWSRVQDVRARAWGDLEAHRRTLVAAQEICDRRGRLSRADRDAVTDLLAGPRGTRTTDDRPIGRPELADGIRRDVVTVRDLFDTVVRVVDALEPVLADVDGELVRAETVVADLGRSLATDPCPALRSRLDATRRTIRDDPLGFLTGTVVHRAPVDELRDDVARAAARADAVHDVRRHGLERLAALGRTADEIDEISRRDAVLGAELALKLGEIVADPQPGGDTVREGVTRGRRLAAQAAWEALAAGLPVLERTAGDALDRAMQRLERHRAPLRERARLRGRLDLYRTKALQAGLGEDPELLDLHRAAHDELWHWPCDLAVARGAVESHEQRVNARLRTEASP